MTDRMWRNLRQALAQVDWRVALMLGPRHRFTEAEWALLDEEAPISLSVRIAIGLNVLALAVGLALVMRDGLQWAGGVLGLLQGWMLVRLGARVWRRPTMSSLYIGYAWIMVIGFLLLFLVGVVEGFTAEMGRASGKSSADEPSNGLLVYGMGVFVIGFLGCWVLAMWRNESMYQWLRQRAAQQRELALAQQLSSAQIQPHFLFNSLASLQHWVESKDDRAAPMLQSLTAYLRATLPLFDRALLPIGQEVHAVQRYLEVMQARLGSRLRFRIEMDPAAADVPLPPGLLLTLAENAVEHGVQPQLAGGEIVLRAVVHGETLTVEVLDDGPGLLQPVNPAQPPADAGRHGGLGLHNCWQRLRQAHGERASLQLLARDEGGCLARVVAPVSSVTPLVPLAPGLA